MRVPLSLLILGGACVPLVLGRGQGENLTPAQVVLRQKMAELEAARKAAAIAPAPGAQLSPQKEAEMRQQLRQAVAPPATPAPQTGPAVDLKPEQEAKVREALERKLAELNGAPYVPAPSDAAAAKPATSTPPAPAPTAAPAALTADQQAKARQALDKKSAELKQVSAPAVPLPPATEAKVRQILEEKILGSNPAPSICPRLETAPAAAPERVLAAPANSASSGLTPEQQAKAREVLAQKMAELQAGASSTPPVAPPAPAAPPPPAAVAIVPVPAPGPATTLTPDKEAQVRLALERSMTDLKHGAVASTAPVAATASPAPPPPATPLPPAAVAIVPAPAPGPATALTPDKEAKVREALEQQMAAVHQVVPAPATPAAPLVPPPVATAPPAPVVTPAPAPSAQTVVIPEPLPPSMKQGLERLAELTELYMAGKITPAVYHQERAKIVESLGKP